MLHALMINNNMFAQVFSALTNLKAYHSYNMAHLQRSFARSNSSCSHRTHTHTHAHAHPFGLLLPLPLLWASFLLTDSVTLADSDIDRYRRLHNTPKNNAALSAQWSGEHSSRRPGILLGLTTPLPKKKVACNMQQALGKSLAMLRVKTRIGIINNVQCYSS